MTTQELRAVPGYDGLYSVTRDGRVWSHPKRPVPGKQGRVHDGHWMTPMTPPSQNGAAQIDLARDGRKHTMRIKKIVRLAWEGTDPSPLTMLPPPHPLSSKAAWADRGRTNTESTVGAVL